MARLLASHPGQLGRFRAQLDLRRFVREGLIRFVAANYPGSLPRVRAGLESDGPGCDAGTRTVVAAG